MFDNLCERVLSNMNFFQVKRDIASNDDEGIKMKEQAILKLGSMFSKHGKAEGIRKI